MEDFRMNRLQNSAIVALSTLSQWIVGSTQAGSLRVRPFTSLWAALLFLGLAVLSGPSGGLLRADIFGTGANSFEIEFVTIGNPGNPPDANPNPAGAVPYEYRMGKYEISEQMIDKANALGGLGITKDSRGSDKPARFVNWLNTSTGNSPAYKFDSVGSFLLWDPIDPGYNPANLYRNRLAKYFLPSIDEWHKAAYYDPVAGVYYDYPSGSDIVPDGIDFVGDPEFDAVFNDGASNPEPNDILNVGLLSPYGTAGQGGNVAEWEETAFDRVNSVADEHRRAGGGAWTNSHSVLNATNTLIGDSPLLEGPFLGLRVASIVPEPNALPVAIVAMIVLLTTRFRGRHHH
jgi:formylglycine-generating enzyme